MNILIIRRDNIGDLLCTTPLLRGLKDQLKVSRLDVVTNSYVAPVLKGSHFIDHLYIYHKLKHGHTSFLKAAFERFRLIFNLRKNHYDYILAFDHRALNLTRFLRKTKVLMAIQDWADQTEVERAWELGQRIGLKGLPGSLALPLYSSSSDIKNTQILGIHISARRVRQQYPISQWINLIRALHDLDTTLIFHVFWSPGDSKSPMHPGDDDKALILKEELKDLPVKFISTPTLESLIECTQRCCSMIMADGGAMHIAAALNRPIIALFGDSNPKRWRPWGVPYKILQNNTKDVKDIEPSKIIDAWLNLINSTSTHKKTI
ncbi:GT9_LPS_heptosyltransferase domain containing protein [Candidatus Methylopumilus universalis]|uniref:glycosyltransferase family 9 protein n=1 Tax=Candidatus Methylopumilus universalis TaxID=2588536 RepID=UPI003BEF3857